MSHHAQIQVIKENQFESPTQRGSIIIMIEKISCNGTKSQGGYRLLTSSPEANCVSTAWCKSGQKEKGNVGKEGGLAPLLAEDKKNHMNMAMSHIYTKSMSESWPVFDEDF